MSLPHIHVLYTYQDGLHLVIWIIPRGLCRSVDLEHGTNIGVNLHPPFDMFRSLCSVSHFFQTVAQFHVVEHLSEVEGWLTLEGHFANDPQKSDTHLGGGGGGGSIESMDH